MLLKSILIIFFGRPACVQLYSSRREATDFATKVAGGRVRANVGYRIWKRCR